MHYSGTYGIGKSTLWVRFLQTLRSLCTEHRFKGGILWCFSERTSIPTGELNALNLNIRYYEGVAGDFKNQRDEPYQFISDDLLNEAYSSGILCDLFTKGSHHRSILIMQNIFHQSKHCRDISLNAKYLVLLRTLGIEASSPVWHNKSTI